MGSVCSRIAITCKPFPCAKTPKHFPSYQLLSRLHAEAWTAVPLQNPAGNPIGVLMATFRVAHKLSTAKFVLEVFAQRAAAELLHKQEKDKLRKSEQRYRALIALNNDGMWCAELDQPIPTEFPAEDRLNLG